MNLRIASSGVLALALFGCQNPDYTEPDEANTGNPPADASTVYTFDSTRAPAYLGPNLERVNAVQAAFVNTELGITTMPVNGLQPDFAGAEANLLGGVGFGTYANPDYRQPVDWAGAGDFTAVVTADITFTSPGDSVLICRSFATTCVELIHDYQLGFSVAIVRLAANAPDTEIGEIGDGVSAAIRGTGAGGLTIALTDESVVGLPFLVSAGTEFTLQWTTSRGDIPGSIDWSVAINGAEIGSGNTLADMSTSIVKTGGVGLIFDTPLGDGVADWPPPLTVDYYTDWEGRGTEYYDYPWVYVDPPGVEVDLPVALTPQAGLGYAPLYVYGTTDGPYAYATYSGVDGLPHAVQAADGILGMVMAPNGSSSQQFVYSVAFDGDDFADTDFEDQIDQGIAGGGFYPSPAFCYNQIVPLVEAQVRAGARQVTHQQMYARLATGVTSADANLPSLVAGINTIANPDITYTDINTTGLGDSITIGTDYADSNVDTAIATSAEDTYAATLSQTVSITFRTELNTVLATLEANNNAILTALVNAGPFTMQNYMDLKALQFALNTPPGVMDGAYVSPSDIRIDEYPPFNFSDCLGYECSVQWILRDLMTGDNERGVNPNEGIPALGGACLWGVPASPAVDATPAVLVPDTNFSNDYPAYPAVPATAATPPVRELAAESMNELVMGIYGNFYTAVFGPGVPASNFSLALGAGDPTAASGPFVSSLVITNGTAAAAE